MRWRHGATALLLVLAMMSWGASAAPTDYRAIVAAIAADIASLKSAYPQLALFPPAALSQHDVDDLVIDYEYHTHAPQPVNGRPIAGWGGGVPHPDEDGVWFYIHLYDAETAHQIDTQPADVWHLCIGEKRVTFLILEGKSTKPLAARLRDILVGHGAKPCG